MHSPHQPPEPARNGQPPDLRSAEVHVHRALQSASDRPLDLVSAIDSYTEIAGKMLGARSAEHFLRSLEGRLPDSAHLLRAVLFRAVAVLARQTSTHATAGKAFAAAEAAFSKIVGTSDEAVLRANPTLVEKHLAVVKERLQAPETRDLTVVNNTIALIKQFNLLDTKIAAELSLVFAQIYLRCNVSESARVQLVRCPPERLAALGSTRQVILQQRMVQASYHTISGQWSEARAIYSHVIETESPNSRVYWQAVEQLIAALEHTTPRHPDHGTGSYLAKVLSNNPFADTAAPISWHQSRLKFALLCKRYPEIATPDTTEICATATKYALTVPARSRILFETLARTLAVTMETDVVSFLAEREAGSGASDSREYRMRLATLRKLAAIELTNQSRYDGAAALYRSVLAAIQTGAARELERDILKRQVCVLEHLEQFEETAECYQRLAELPSELDESSWIHARRSIHLARARALFMARNFKDVVAAVEQSELLDTNGDDPIYTGGPSTTAFPFYLYALDQIGAPREKMTVIYRAFSPKITDSYFGRTVNPQELIRKVADLVRENSLGSFCARWPQLVV
jgi:tetratricopeptide (TPR) repeat protein